jgi:hypothetical protein
MAHELPLPPAAEADERSLEMIRVWLAQGLGEFATKSDDAT